jgi:hypothetical protein
MKTSIIWIFGTSAAGKETFIKYCSEENIKDLRKVLNWSDRKVVPCLESMEWIAQYDGDIRGEMREDLLRVIPELVTQNPQSIVLVKGQDIDLYNNRLRRLQAALPECEHQIIFLDGDIDEQFERWKKKSWYDTCYSKETVIDQIHGQVRLLVGQNFPIKALYVHSIGDYQQVSFPPSL